MSYGLITEIAKQAAPWIIKRAYDELSPLLDTELLQPVPPLNRRLRAGTWVNRSQPDPHPERHRAGDGSFSCPCQLTYAG
jgi:hypothetical protein